MAGILIAYHPFQKPQPHYQLIVSGSHLLLSDSTTGQVWLLNPAKREWTRLELPKPQ